MRVNLAFVRFIPVTDPIVNIMSVLAFCVAALAVARITGLITADTLTEPTRNAILKRLGHRRTHRLIATLITCPWCVSIWVSAAVALVVYTIGTTTVTYLGAIILAWSQLTGMLSQLGRGD